ncbi:MAG TPA: hypothetical protein VM890_06335, partial [Longimicrobium sp.]|nr:hypothetical protein [Longimicrobium sp.]
SAGMSSVRVKEKLAWRADFRPSGSEIVNPDAEKLSPPLTRRGSAPAGAGSFDQMHDSIT